MVFPTEQQPSDTYHLWRRFSFPTKHGSIRAIAVDETAGNRINTLYAILLEMMFAEIIAIILLVVLHVSISRTVSQDAKEINRKVKKEQHEPFSLAGSLGRDVRTLRKDNSRFWWLPLVWIAVVLSTWVGPKTLPLLVTPRLLIGNSAPVVASKVYFPQTPKDGDGLSLSVFVKSQGPAALRTIGTVGIADSTTQNLVHVTNPKVTIDRVSGQKDIEIDYNYDLGALDFGMQRFEGLSLHVEGSCRTEYNWLKSTENDFPRNFRGIDHKTDAYHLWNNDYYLNGAVFTSLLDGWAPRAFFYPQYPANDTWIRTQPKFNYAIVISSVNRTSFSQGFDPWYLTGAVTEPAPAPGDPPAWYVQPRRPALSCWESNFWSYKGHKSSVADLVGIPGLKFPPGLQAALYSQLLQPKILNVGRYLSGSALASSEQVTDYYFDAKSSSIYEDMKRLVLAAYVSTANTLLDSTLYGPGTTIPNIVTPKNQDEVAGFVVSSSDIITLSISVLVIVPIFTLLFGIVGLLLGFYLDRREKGPEKDK
ncbi:hypothetical protein BGZ57DRAFT_1010005 [Hyaloscypha finlandica]|nr:hypothetical protein BGZ57DRAFT_1010005 [Hyaloscypha finlandica]